MTDDIMDGCSNAPLTFVITDPVNNRITKVTTTTIEDIVQEALIPMILNLSEGELPRWINISLSDGDECYIEHRTISINP